jgi:hypothetical protein
MPDASHFNLLFSPMAIVHTLSSMFMYLLWHGVDMSHLTTKSHVAAFPP